MLSQLNRVLSYIVYDVPIEPFDSFFEGIQDRKCVATYEPKLGLIFREGKIGEKKLL